MNRDEYDIASKHGALMQQLRLNEMRIAHLEALVTQTANPRPLFADIGTSTLVDWAVNTNVAERGSAYFVLLDLQRQLDREQRLYDDERREFFQQLSQLQREAQRLTAAFRK